jgi:hypothetical protein
VEIKAWAFGSNAGLARTIGGAVEDGAKVRPKAACEAEHVRFMHLGPFMQFVQRHTEYGYVLFVTEHCPLGSAPFPYGQILVVRLARCGVIGFSTIRYYPLH